MASSSQEHFLVQRLACRGEDLDLSWIKRVTFVETLDLSGPQFVACLDDSQYILREDVGLSVGDTLSVSLADPYHTDQMAYDDDFVVLSVESGPGATIVLSCLQKGVYESKRPAAQAQLFAGKGAQTILGQVLPGVDLSVGDFPVVEDYHLLAGMRRSRMVRQLARELGAVAFMQRGELVFRSPADLFEADSLAEYHANDRRQPNQINYHKYTGNSGVMIDEGRRSYQGWSLTQGLLKAGALADSAPECTGLTSKVSLDGMASMVAPCLELEVAGNGGIKAGDALSLVWNRQDLDSPIIETLPDKILVGRVAHTYSAQKYLSRITGVLPVNW